MDASKITQKQQSTGKRSYSHMGFDRISLLCRTVRAYIAMADLKDNENR